MMKPLIICVIGRKGAGKTTLIEALTRDLVNSGIRVSVLKHIHHDNFDVDIRGKDTWRFSKAGAETVIGMSKTKLFMVKQLSDCSANNYPDMDVIKLMERLIWNSDIIFVEGFKYSLGKSRDIHKIIIVRNNDEIKELLEIASEPILGIYTYRTEVKSDLIISYDELKRKIMELLKHREKA